MRLYFDSNNNILYAETCSSQSLHSCSELFLYQNPIIIKMLARLQNIADMSRPIIATIITKALPFMFYFRTFSW